MSNTNLVLTDANLVLAGDGLVNYEASLTPVDTEVVVRTIQEHGEGRVLGTVRFRFALFHPVTILDIGDELLEVDTVDRLRGIASHRVRDTFQLRDVLNGQAVDVNQSTLIHANVAENVFATVIVVTCVGQILKLNDGVGISVETLGAITLLRRVIDEQRGFEPRQDESLTDRLEQVVVDRSVDSGIVTPLVIGGGIQASAGRASGAVLVTDGLAIEASGGRISIQHVNVVRHTVGVQVVTGTVRGLPGAVLNEVRQGPQAVDTTGLEQVDEALRGLVPHKLDLIPGIVGANLDPGDIDSVDHFTDCRLIRIECPAITCISGIVQHDLTSNTLTAINAHALRLVDPTELIVLVVPGDFKVLIREIRQSRCDEVFQVSILGCHVNYSYLKILLRLACVS